jgi:HEPN domain-containing protein
MLHRPTREDDPADWFAFAGERLRGCDILHQHEGVTALGIEAMQESVERYLKGYLIACGWPLERTHDLRRLVAEAAQRDSRFAQFDDMADELTFDFFAQHYPGGDLTNVGENYDSLRQQAGELVKLIRERLPQFFPGSSKAAS